jgi:hypothetical protein
MNEQNTAEQPRRAALADDELNLVVGGNSDPDEPVPTVTGAVDVDSKATPVLL